MTTTELLRENQLQSLHPRTVKNWLPQLGYCYQPQNTYYLPSNESVQQAQHEQNNMGWFPFILGFWSKQFLQCQTDHMKDMQSKKSPILLLSKLQRWIWHIAWKAWEHRNTVLHEDQNSYHPKEIKLINNKIKQEWELGADAIPQQFWPLFGGRLEALMKKKHTAKLKWITTIWSLWETYSKDYFQHNQSCVDPLTRYRYMRWKENQ